ncbi:MULTISPECIES: PH domain-containing protein [Pseudonocardia]|uniref:YokE-like PH domain-containing protein n=2 Tax=Pseudonocardia TaxID=1847 RepID=A0A1Y2N3I2_PSEAH|nr:MULTISPECIES: PH domain-containing protein [Pseudonocardia]OSY42032.1 hypothetical protein BG845_01528 [Pseudonocardia autotrophica]TDN75199.1 PH (Pleckstrin Homology) domain-containing protein [Pseudonocardia autotrophica]BBF99144.1 hypothetical protein Pdca_03540 [Pseudonocardia autotrophica]GEC29488.1 hypothetical protein PSA01_65170 [Pseudonocardia saturnea]
MSGPVFDERDQLDTVAAALLPGERIVAVYDATDPGAGFIGLTDLRVLLQDNAFAGRRTALTSIPYARICSVSLLSGRTSTGGVVASGRIAVTTGPHTYELALRDAGRARHAHDVVLERMLRP